MSFFNLSGLNPYRLSESFWAEISVLFILLYKVTLTFESVYENLKCDHSYESYWAVLSCDAVYYTGFNLWVCKWIPKVWLLKLKLLSSTFLEFYLPYMKSLSVTISMNAIKQHFWKVPLVLSMGAKMEFCSFCTFFLHNGYLIRNLPHARSRSRKSSHPACRQAWRYALWCKEVPKSGSSEK